MFLFKKSFKLLYTMQTILIQYNTISIMTPTSCFNKIY